MLGLLTLNLLAALLGALCEALSRSLRDRATAHDSFSRDI